MPDILSYSASFCVAGEDYHVVKAQLDDFYDNEEFLKMCQTALPQEVNTVGDIIQVLRNLSPADKKALHKVGICSCKVTSLPGPQALGGSPTGSTPDFSMEDAVR